MLQEECVKIDSHLKNVNITHLSGVVIKGNLALEGKDFSGALNAYWKVFKKTYGYDMLEKIMDIHMECNPRYKKIIEDRLFAAVAHISSKVGDKNERYGILFSFRELMLDHGLVVMARRIEKIQKRMIDKNEVTLGLWSLPFGIMLGPWFQTINKQQFLRTMVQ